MKQNIGTGGKLTRKVTFGVESMKGLNNNTTGKYTALQRHLNSNVNGTKRNVNHERVTSGDRIRVMQNQTWT